jgi:hypothetical protein
MVLCNRATNNADWAPASRVSGPFSSPFVLGGLFYTFQTNSPRLTRGVSIFRNYTVCRLRPWETQTDCWGGDRKEKTTHWTVDCLEIARAKGREASQYTKHSHGTRLPPAAW